MPKSNPQLEGGVGKLSDVVKISRQFLRSVRIDADSGREDALSGYVCQGTARSLLENMARQLRDTKQRAFTWTGPYGGGKSSLALMLCSLVGKNKALRNRAKKILDLPANSVVLSEFDARNDGWLVVPLVGKRAKVSEELRKALELSKGETPSKRKSKKESDVIGQLVAAAEQHSHGVLVVIDELGKFLESVAQDGEDVYFFQELAEAASRASGKLIVVGILHQSFEAYAARLSRQARDDWAKIQGRFVDIPLIAGTDEVVELVGRAISVYPGVDRQGAEPFAIEIARAIGQRRPGTPAGLGYALSRCWPLHPVVASLLGPISRRRFSQNERSTFGFLASREPLGFMEFLDGHPIDWTSIYGPSRYWDYLCANMETAILASPDGHRWAVASEAVERAESKGTPIHIEVTKCVALIEMFRGGSGLLPELDVLGECVQGASKSHVTQALHDLVSWQILIERKHLGAYGVFSGSDFDIEGAISNARSEIGSPDLKQLSALTDLQPIVAKRLYHETGSMRWFTRHIVRLEDAEAEAASFREQPGSVGSFFLCLPSLGSILQSATDIAQNLSKDQSGKVLIIGIPSNADRIAELGLELVACDHVFKTRRELDGDSVARKELLNRTGTVRSALEDELGDAFGLSSWFWQGELQDSYGNSSVAWIASNVAESIYHKSPNLQNELINRQEPSSNSNRARKDLMYRMIGHAASANLGYEGYPADAGLYFSILQRLGLHRVQENELWGFGEPFHHGHNENLYSLWVATRRLLLEEGSIKKLSELYAMWAAPPYGLRAGIMPVLALAFFLANRSAIALYVEQVFTPDLSEAIIDEWLQDPKRVALRFVSASSDQSAYLQAVASSIPSSAQALVRKEPLEVARALVSLVVSLPNWTRRTTTVSSEAQAIRAMLLKANDPHKVLFADLPTLLDARDANEVQSKLSCIMIELADAYPKILKEVMGTVLRALDQAEGDLQKLNSRAKVVKGIAGEFRLEAFIGRLENFDETPEAIEGLISLASSKPPAQWVDRDIDGALLQLGNWAHEFRRAETLAPLRGRPSTRRSIGVVFSAGSGQDVSVSVDIDGKDDAVVNKLAARLVADLRQQPRELALAALAEAGALLFKPLNEEVT